MNPLQKQKLNGLLLGTSCLVAAALIGALPALAGSSGSALPTGGKIKSGHGSISTSGDTTTVDQTSEKAFINWNSFSIGNGDTVRIDGPNKNAVTVNRVTGNDPTKIYGKLLSNDNVWLLNGNGVLFGKGSIINVGSLIATTSDLSDDDFKKGKYRFTTGSNPDATVVNRGTITAAQGGSVVLSAAHVANEGVVKANLGSVVLGGANAFTVDLNGDNLIRYQVTSEVKNTPTNSKGEVDKALVSNSGKIEADGGTVLMTSRAASRVQDNVINNSGVVEANSVSSHDGEVDFDAGSDGTVEDSGIVRASGLQAGETGGTVKITGENVVVADGARVNARGYQGGGTVLIGGNFHGAPGMRQASNVIIGKATIDVKATHKGNGGKVAIWSKGNTSFGGTVIATGGYRKGNGGYVETSGHLLSIDGASVTTLAARGDAGTWLIDPYAVEICSSCNSTNTTTAITTGNISSALANGDVTIEADGGGANSTITWDSNATLNYSSANALSLLAEGSIVFKSSVQNTGTGDINLVAGWDGSTGISGNATNGQSNGTGVNMSAILSGNDAYGNNNGAVTIGYTGASGNGTIAVGTEGGTTIVAAQDLNVGVAGNSTANMQLGFAGNNGAGDIDIYLTGNLTVISDQGGISQIGNTALTNSGVAAGNITITAATVTVNGEPSGGEAIIGNTAGTTASGNISITTSGDVMLESGYGSDESASVALIGSETTKSTGTTSGSVTVSAGGNLSLYAGYGGVTRIGSYNSTSKVKVTAAGNITMDASGEEKYNSVQIGNFGSNTSTVGGNISVTSTGGNITLMADSPASVEIGNSGGVHVSGDVSVVADNGSIALNADYSGAYLQIGNSSGVNGATVGGNITVFAGTTLALNSNNSRGYSQIGNFSYAGSGGVVSGDIFVSAFGGTTLNGYGGTTVWIGNTGATETGDVTLVTGSLSVEQGGAGDNETFGNMVASDLTGAITTATAGTGGSGGGNVTIAIEGQGTTYWSSLFGSGLDFANGNTLSLITTGAQNVGTSITATENGSINLVAGWDGTTGYGPKSITVSQILSTPTAYGASGGDVAIGGTGNVFVGTVSGNTTVAGANIGVSSYGGAQAVIGALGSSSGNITVQSTGNVTVSAPNGGTAQIGNGGASEAGDVGGNITINAEGKVVLDAAEGNAQIGNGGANANGNFSGNIDIVAGAAIVVEGGGSNGVAGYAQIGNGGAGSNDGDNAGSDSGNITVRGTSVSVEAGSGNGSYAQIGHGGASSDEASGAGTTGNIKVVATDGDVLLQGGSTGDTGEEDNDYAQIGMGGPFSGTNTSNKDRGDITVNASGNISILGGTDTDQQNGFAIIGDTGTAQKSGNITVAAGGNITITGGSATGHPDFGGLSNSFAMIGDDNAGSITGDVRVTAGGDLALSGGGNGSTGDTAEIGDNSSNSNVIGNLSVSVGGTLSFTSTGDAALIADLASGTATGTTLIKTADIDLNDDYYGDLGRSLAADLNNGNTTLEITDSSADTVIAGAVDYSSANTLKILDTGSLHIQSSIQNSGSGAIYVVGGWDGTTTDASNFTNAGVYGNNGGSITVGDVLGDVAVGSRGGTTTFAADNIDVDAVAGLAQIGWDGNHGGNISVVANGNITLETAANDECSNCTALVGNGGTNVSGNVTGNISVTTMGGSIGISAQGGYQGEESAQSIAAIGNIGGNASSESGNITIDTNGGALTLTSDGDLSYAQIGDWSVVYGDTGKMTGDIAINAGAVSLDSTGSASSSQIGNGNYLYVGSTGAISGNITIDATTLSVLANAPEDGFEEARIGNLGSGAVSGAVDVTTTGNILISANGEGAASIGNFSSHGNGDGYDQGKASGTIDVNSGGNLTVEADGSGAYASIEIGGAESGTVDVTANGDITESASDGSGVLIGALVIDNGGTNIAVTSKHGDVNIEADGNSSARLGNEQYSLDTGGDVSGNVSVTAQRGNITISATNDSLTQVGNLGDTDTGDTVTGNLTLTAGDVFDIATTANTTIGNTGAGESGDVAITAKTLQGDITPVIESDLPGGDFSLVLTGNSTLTMAEDIDYDTAHSLTISNGGNIVFDASLQNSGSGDITIDSGNTVIIGGAGATGDVAVGSAKGTTTVESKNLQVLAQNGSAQLGFGGAGSGDIVVVATGTVVISSQLSGAVAQIGDTIGNHGPVGSVDITAHSLTSSGDALITADSADITMTGGGSIGTASNSLDVLVNDLAISSNGGSAYIASAQGLSVGVGADGIDLGGGDLVLTAHGSISQTEAIVADAVDITASQGTIALTDAQNEIAIASLSAKGSASLYDSASLTVDSVSVGGNLTLLTEGNLTFVSSVQLTNGNLLAVAGWDGTTTAPSALVEAGAYGNNNGSIIVGGATASGNVAVGSAKGSTTLAGSSVTAYAANGYAQIGYNGAGSGDIDVIASNAVTLTGGAGAGDYAQIGNGGMGVSGNESGNISVAAGGAVTLDGGKGSDAYAQIGHGGADADKNSHGYTNSGTITVDGESVTLAAGAGNQSYAQIGNGGFDLGDGLTGQGINKGDITVTATDGVTLTGNGTDAYAQIGNGGDQVNANARASAGGSNSGNIDVTAGSGVSMIAGANTDAYAQIGNGGFGTNAFGDADASNFEDSGTITVSDLVLTGSNTGNDSYAQIGNGDASQTGIGNVSGDITIDAGSITLKNGSASGANAAIANITGDGTVSGTVTGYTPNNTDSTTQGVVTSLVAQTSPTNTQVDLVITNQTGVEAVTAASDVTVTNSHTTGPLGDLSDNTESNGTEAADTETDELGQSLGSHKHNTQAVSLIPGVLTQVVDTETTHGIPPADQNFSSWGNEALWRW
jgi:filamentous hemagglutinin family protein